MGIFKRLRIYDEINFRNLITELQETNSNIENISEDLIGKQIENFSNDLSPIILEKIVHYFSRKRFEDLIMAILKERENNGEIINPYVYRGWGVDQGCDIEFTYFNQILNKKEMVIIQLKAYTGKAFISEAITNLSNHLNNGKTANQAIIMTTANIIDEKDFLNALNEIKKGKKLTYWIWYIFPQLEGLGKSEYAVFYGIKNVDEAEEYLNHPILGKRLIEICSELLNLEHKTANQIFGSPDDLKVRSCMTLFSSLKDTDPVFSNVLDKYYQGIKDPFTMKLI